MDGPNPDRVVQLDKFVVAKENPTLCLKPKIWGVFLQLLDEKHWSQIRTGITAAMQSSIVHCSGDVYYNKLEQGIQLRRGKKSKGRASSVVLILENILDYPTRQLILSAIDHPALQPQATALLTNGDWSLAKIYETVTLQDMNSLVLQSVGAREQFKEIMTGPCIKDVLYHQDMDILKNLSWPRGGTSTASVFMRSEEEFEQEAGFEISP